MKDCTIAFITKLVVAVALIVLGLYTCFTAGYSKTSYDSYYTSKLDKERKSSYGGDAYTGIQNAGAQTATNAYYIYQRVDDFANKALVTAGWVITICGIEKLCVTLCNQIRKE